MMTINHAVHGTMAALKNCRKNRDGPLGIGHVQAHNRMSSATEKFRKVAEAAATVAINLARPNYFSSSEKGTTTVPETVSHLIL